MRFSSAILLLWPQCVSTINGLSRDSALKSEAVKAAFRYAWHGYFKCAYPGDTADTVNCIKVNDRGAWGVTAIDSLSTALIMNLTDIAALQIDSALSANYEKLGNDDGNFGILNAFETTIRTLGGLISAHDLLQQGFGKDIPDSDSKAILLAMQAQVLAETLNPIWNTTSGMPAAAINFNSNPPSIYEDPDDLVQTNSVAAIGTSQLEYARLSDITGLSKYVDRSVSAARRLFKAPLQDGLEPMFPGLLGKRVDIKTGKQTTNIGGWVGQVDSFYEYCLKLPLYDPLKYGDFFDRYKTIAKSTVDHLISRPKGFPDVTFLAGHNGSSPDFSSQHLACFAGGNLLLSSSITHDSNVAIISEDLIKGCHWAYKETATGLAPEQWHWYDENGGNQKVNPNPGEQAYFKVHGFWPFEDAKYYSLRPEHVESLFYGWRITHDQIYRDWAWEVFLAINQTQTKYGYAPVLDVTVKEERTPKNSPLGDRFNKMESFFLAETLKYLYLIFADTELLPLSEWVFNTEAHPFRIKHKDIDQTPYHRCFTDRGCADVIHIPQMDESVTGIYRSF